MEPGPFPLTTMERVFWWEDRPSHPFYCCLHVRFSGALNRVRFEQASRLALDRHPLLRSRLHGPRDGRPAWQPGPSADVPVEWHAGGVGGRYPDAHPIDLFAQPPTRLVVRAEPDRAEFFLQVHHACSDGRGILEFMADLASAYGRLSGVPTSPLPPLSPAKLRERGRITLNRSQLWSLLSHGGEIARFLFKKPVPITPIASPYSGYAVRHAEDFTLGVNETDALKRTARALEVNVNDLLIRDFFLALARRRRSWGVECAGDRLRLMIPVSLRTHRAVDLPAANVLSPIFLDRLPEDTADPAALLAGIHAEMKVIKQHHLALLFVLAHGLTGSFGRLMRAQFRKPRCWLSASLTNIGRLPTRGSPPTLPDGRIVVGDVIVESIHGIAPNRPGQAATLVVISYAGRLHFNLHTDIHHLSSRQALELRDAFLACLHDTIQTSTRQPPPSPGR